MSLEYEDLSSGYESYEISDIVKKQLKIIYSREFLLSFSELVICKKLPSGFDPSILRECEDAFHGVQERQRAPVGSQLQGYKRSEYSSSPPTRGDFDSYSRSSYGRWDRRSSGRSDRDSDSHSDKDSDSGRHHVNPSQQPWKSSDHDSLLGSGSFSRAGYGSGNPSQKSRVTDDYQLNRSNGPYHPPRPYKVKSDMNWFKSSCVLTFKPLTSRSGTGFRLVLMVRPVAAEVDGRCLLAPSACVFVFAIIV